MWSWSKLAIRLCFLIGVVAGIPVSSQGGAPTDDMIFIKGVKFKYQQQNRWREGLERLPYVEGPIGDAYVDEYWVELQSYYIDRTEVTNKKYKMFLESTHYQPKDTTNFLKHWKNGTYPEGQADFPVVYVDYMDATAYADWADKQLPTEAQWQYAAQGPDYLIFPWGNNWDPAKANVGSTGAKPVGSYPEGRSVFGCLDMVGNAAEMTASRQEDGWHTFSFLRGGSWFQSFASLWYTENGLLTNEQRLKFWWLNPGFNRSSAIGFRCVKNFK
jgi:gamma-glutamyl hercynylcysteine S-oxide synthase